MTDYPIEHWTDEQAIGALDYSSYWNDEEEEKGKEWYVVDGDFDRLERFVHESDQGPDLDRCLKWIADQDARPTGVALDAASGVCWAVPRLLALPGIESVTCVEMSVHRLTRIAPVVLDHYGVPREKATLAIGSFYDLRIPAGSVGLALLSSALHHADDPERLLKEIHRVMKPDGYLVVTCEHIVDPTRNIPRYVAKAVLSRVIPRPLQAAIFKRTLDRPRLTLSPKTVDLHPTDPVLGDHYHTTADYQRMFHDSGFTYMEMPAQGSTFRSFILRPISGTSKETTP